MTVYGSSTPAAMKYLNRGQCTSTRYIYIRCFVANALDLFPCFCIRQIRSAERFISVCEAVPYIEQKGRPVNIQFFGGLNLPELYKHVTPEMLVESIIVNADALTREVLPAACRAAGRHIGQSLVIVDLKGFG